MTTSQPIKWRAFALPKRGHKAEEYEDAYAGDARVGRFAVADGASESSFANRWARLLVDAFVQAEKEGEGEWHWLERPQQRWAAEVDGQQLAWYAEEKRDMGAHATLLGVTLRPAERGPGGKWKAVAVGDSCLFQVRGDALLHAFPLTSSASFGNQPALLCSRPRGGKVVLPRPKVEWGEWKPGDQFFLLTDAIAQWFLRRHEARLKPWVSLAKRLREAKPDAALGALVEKLRDEDAMRNDDVTIVTIDLLAQE
ncbi:hypothetical protein AYO44_00870 [Planctomycetaceae bacterium SCGC AG-212-F19]|nr:hypothetical protein AYO44_00870 [Planctomycetaceae bacterium SCGC AG-212-F19]